MSERKRSRSVVHIGSGGIKCPKQCGIDRSPVSADRQGVGAALSPSHLHRTFTSGHSTSMIGRVISDFYRVLSPRRRPIDPGIHAHKYDVIAEGASGTLAITRASGNGRKAALRSLTPPTAFHGGA